MDLMEVYNVEGKYLKKHKKTIKSLLQNIISYLAQKGSAGGPPKALQLLEKTVEQLKMQKEIDNNDGTRTPNNLNDTLKAIQLSLARIERKGITPPKAKSYAAAAKSGSGKDPKLKLIIAKQVPQAPFLKETRRAKEITVHITDKADRERVKTLPTKDLVEALQADTNRIRGMSRLINSDIKIHTESPEAKKALQEQSKWTQKMAKSAAVQVRIFFVQANGIKMENIKVANQSAAIGYLQTANTVLHSGLKIIKLAWLLRAIREKKKFSTLYMEVATAAMANQLITKGLMEDYEIKNYEQFTNRYTMTQCFNCQKYGHIGKSCQNQVACSHCADGHQSKECTLETGTGL